MHYKDGTEAKLGDTAKFPGSRQDGDKWVEVERVGIVVAVSPGSTACNASIAFANLRKSNPFGAGEAVPFVTLETTTITLGDCELVHRA